MGRWFLVAALILSTAVNLAAGWEILHLNEIRFGNAISVFNGNPQDGSIVVTGEIPRQRTAIDLWPVDDELPERHAITETVWYRTRFRDWPTFERLSLSALANPTGTPPQYRFSAERGGSGEHRPIFFCFDGLGVVGQPAYCPLRIDPALGVLICAIDGKCKSIDVTP